MEKQGGLPEPGDAPAGENAGGTGASPVLPPAGNPLLSMWLRPQATIRHIVSRPPRASVLLLAVAAEGAGLITPVAMNPEMADRFHWFALMLLAFAAAAPLGIAALYIGAALVSVSGRMLGGRATQRELRAAFAWAGLPNAALLIVLTAGLLTGGQVFLEWITPGGGGDVLLVLTAALWALVLRIRTIGAVQHFGAGRSIANLALASVTVAVIGGLVFVFLFQPFYVPAGSMEPTIMTGDHIFASKTHYGYSRFSFPGDMRIFDGRVGAAKAKRGDIAIFRYPADTRTVYVKRVVGLPGDKIQVTQGVLHINSEPVQLRRAGDHRQPDGIEGQRLIPRYEETLPNGVKYMVLRESGTDSTFQNNTRVYQVPAGHYFMLGDNRDNSMDSRFPQFGFVPVENLIGKVALTYFSAEKVNGTESLSQAFDNLRWKKMFRRPK